MTTTPKEIKYLLDRLDEHVSKLRKADIDPVVADSYEMEHHLTKINNQLWAWTKAKPIGKQPPPSTKSKLKESMEVKENLEDEFDDYMDSVLGAVLDAYEDEDEESAVDYILEIADELAEEGILPPFPDEDSTSEEVAEWVGAAQSAGFAGMVIDSWY